MHAWSDGYMTDVEYTYGYYTELNPLRTRLALLNAGYAFPQIQTACELGFGQGLSINIHSASSTVEWYGTDFNPAQAGFAKELADDPERAARLFDEAFDSFCRRADLPEFDFIGLHGIWSWISDGNRAAIADIIKRKLRVGGVLYISYNTQPGWAALAPLRDLLTGYNDTLAAPGLDMTQRIGSALEFAKKLLETDAGYAKANPAVLEQLKHLAGQNRNYLAHEYFNRDWLPMPFTRMMEWLAPLKLNFAGSAHYLDHIDALNLTANQQRLLDEIPDRCFRETSRDFMVNQRFRRDYWVRGARRLKPLEQVEQLRAQQIILAISAHDVELKAKGTLGEHGLKQEIYGPLLETLADHRPHFIGEIEGKLAPGGITLSAIVQALMVLAGNGTVHPVQDEQSIRKSRAATDALNARLCRQARYSGDIVHLASPVTGGGIMANRFEQLFLLGRNFGLAGPAKWAKYACDVLVAQNQRILKDGKQLESIEQQLDELGQHALRFAELRLPVFKALGIAS